LKKPILSALTLFLKTSLKYETFAENKFFKNFGYVVQVGDGIARCDGLEKVMSGELLSFPRTLSFGLALNLENQVVGVVLFTVEWLIKAGDLVEATGAVMSVPIGNELLGCVIDPLGRALVGHLPKNLAKRRIEVKAPGILARKSVHEPVQTGIKAIDCLLPIGRGQRELIIGDRQTGKTALVIDTILNQRELNKTLNKTEALFCIYVAIGQKNLLSFKLLKL